MIISNEISPSNHAVVLFLLQQLGFKVTNKDGEVSEFRKSFNWIIPFLIYYFMASLAMGFGVLKMYFTYQYGGNHGTSDVIAVGVSLLWICITMWQMWPPIGMLLKSLDAKPHKAAVQEERV